MGGDARRRQLRPLRASKLSPTPAIIVLCCAFSRVCWSVVRRNSMSSAHVTPLTGAATPLVGSLPPPLALPPVSHHSTPMLPSQSQAQQPQSGSLAARRGSSSAGPGSAAPTPLQRASPHLHAALPSLSLGAAASPYSPPAALSAQQTNPYLSHTAFGGAAVTSRHHGFDATEAEMQSGADEADAHAAALHAHAQQVHQAQAAAAAAAAAAYYPYALHGFMGPGFILGHASPPPPHLSMMGDALSSHSAPPSSLPILGPSSSCPSPLLTSTSERRRSKPHIQFVPPTHAVAPGGLVLPLLPAPGQSPVSTTTGPSRPRRSTTSRVSHAFNLFGLPPVWVWEIRVPAHVYLLTALVLYLIGPPALIPLVAAFFFYRWHLNSQAAAAGRNASDAAGSAAVGEPNTLAGAKGASPPPAATHPSGVPKSLSAPIGTTQRRHPNIHSLYD